MVKHGTNKKRLSGRKVTRKGPKHPKLKVVNSLVSKDIKAKYDSTVSPMQNLANMGLDPDPNNSRKKAQLEGSSEPVAKDKAAFMGFAVIPQVLECILTPLVNVPYLSNDLLPHMQSANFADTNAKRRVMSETDQAYAKSLILKYKDNYKKMEKDITTNYNQLTEAKCKATCEKFLGLDAAQRLIAFP